MRAKPETTKLLIACVLLVVTSLVPKDRMSTNLSFETAMRPDTSHLKLLVALTLLCAALAAVIIATSTLCAQRKALLRQLRAGPGLHTTHA